jgi:sigma-E factor negative regulatory protein RseC
MQENGIVSKVTKSGNITVRLSRKTACENCRMCLLPKNEMYVELKFKNTLNLKKGDYVKISMNDRAVVSSSIIVYFFPLLILAIVLLLTYKLDLWICLTSSIGSLVISFIAIALVDKYVLRKKVNFYPSLSLVEEMSDTEKSNLRKIMENTTTYELQDDLGNYTLDSTTQKGSNIENDKKDIKEE